MGIQINGQTDTISAADGGVIVSGYELSGPSNINVTGVVTATTFNGALSGNVTGNLNSSGVSTISQLNVGTGGTVITTTAGGLVGVGTINPLGVLAVSGGVSNPTITFQNGSATATATDAAVGSIVGYSRTTGGNINIGSVDIRTDTGSASSGAVRILTASNGVLAETLRVNSSGNVTVSTGNLIIGTSGKGIDFSATANSSGTMASELLSDYEEGTFTPTVTSAGYTISSSSASYTKIGRQVFIHVRVNFSAVSGSSNSTVSFSGLPFSSSNSVGHYVGVARETTNNGEVYAAQVNINSSNFSFNSYNGVANGSTAIIATGEDYDISITYLT